MKSLWNSFLIALSMYSRIPVPQAEWTEKNLCWALCFFPLVGAVIGALGLVGVWWNKRLLDRKNQPHDGGD